jgi:flagellar biosynthesis/type III secretory pathway chaperone
MTIATAPRVGDLVDLLAEEERLYGELLEIGQREQGAILGNEPAGLSAVILEKVQLVERLAQAETERQSWLNAWAAANGGAGATTLGELTRHLAAPDAARVAVVRDALLRRIRDVAEMNNRNSQLLGGALRIVNRSIEAYSRLGGASSGYEPSGERARATRTIVLDRRV